jgi:hypothetical protein
MEGQVSGYILDHEERCEIEIETCGARGARSGSSTTWNLKQGVQGWSVDMDPEGSSWGALVEMEGEEGERC